MMIKNKTIKKKQGGGGSTSMNTTAIECPNIAFQVKYVCYVNIPEFLGFGSGLLLPIVGGGLGRSESVGLAPFDNWPLMFLNLGKY